MLTADPPQREQAHVIHFAHLAPADPVIDGLTGDPNKRKASAQQGRCLVCNLAAKSVIAAAIGKNRDPVFPSPKRDEAMYRINNHGWRAACQEAGLTMRVHDLRHSFGDTGRPMEAAWVG